MGRIILFTLNGCTLSHRAKRELQHRCLPFLEISLSAYPHRRKGMTELSGKMTVPQVFLNSQWLGGCGELLALLDEWDGMSHAQGAFWQIYLEEVANKPDPVDPRLSHPMTPLGLCDEQLLQHHDHGHEQHQDTTANGAFGGSIPLPDGTTATIGEVTTRLLERMPRQRLAYLAKFYSECCPGDRCVDTLMEVFPQLCRSQNKDNNEDRQKAVAFGLLLQRHGILHHVCNEHSFQDTGNYYYRLQPFHQPHVLNSFQSQQQVVFSLPSHLDSETRTFLEENTASSSNSHMLDRSGALKLLMKLHTLLSEVEFRAMGRDGIDFLAAKNYNDLTYVKLEEGSCQLQCMDGIALATMTDAEKTVFGIQLYNAMTRMAFIKLGVPTTASQRRAFFTGVSFKISNQMLSLDDVEHGILRANTRHPYHLKPQFVGGDPRRAWAVQKFDARIHFTLWCGAKACPAINCFTVDNLEQELQSAAEAFCLDDNNVVVDETSNTLTLSMVFKWYKTDFGCLSSKTLPGVVLLFLPAESDKRKSLAAMIQKDTPSSQSHSPECRHFTIGMPSRNHRCGRGSTPDKRESWGGRISHNRGEGIKVKFIPFDWAPQAAPGNFVKFTSSTLTTTETSLRAPFSKTATAGISIGGRPKSQPNKVDCDDGLRRHRKQHQNVLVF